MNSRSLSSRLHDHRVMTACVHLLCIVILLVLPEVLMYYTAVERPPTPWVFYLKSAVYLVVFYANYFFFIDSTIGRPRGAWKLAGWNVAVVALSLVVLWGIWASTMPAGHPGPQHSPLSHSREAAMVVAFLLRDLAMLVLVISLALVLRLSGRWLTMEHNRERSENLHRQEELNSLKSQLNPHFLFNTLNSIYALIDLSPDMARDAVHELSRLLRYTLYDTSRQVTLGRELAFINDYIRLMRLRMAHPERLQVTLDPGPCADMEIAPLLFITLIENVFKHSAQCGSPEPVMEITITASAPGTVECTTLNTIDPDAKHGAGGIGIANLRRRLGLLYPGAFTLHTGVTPDALHYRTTLIIKISHPQPTAP